MCIYIYIYIHIYISIQKKLSGTRVDERADGAINAKCDLRRPKGTKTAKFKCNLASSNATWRLLGPTWPSKPHSKCNLALLGSIFGALATLRIELSPTRELDFHVFALLPCKTVF